MFNVSKWGTRSKLATRIMPKDTELALIDGHAARFYTGSPDDWFYATLRDGGQLEHVKVTGVRDGKLIVQRGQDGTEARQFNTGTCVEVEWNPAQVCEHVRSCVLGFETTGIRAGTYCFECKPCIDVNKYGQITAIREGKGC